jgi:preprotein translocase subunit YajC
MPSDVLYILIYVVLAVVLAFFLKISPARNVNLNKKKMLVDLKAGDQIIMECGIYGTVKEIKDDQVKICVNDNAANTEMLIEKSAIKTIMVQE